MIAKSKNQQPIAICAFWFRNWCSDYCPFYINALFRSILRNVTELPPDSRFILFTDSKNIRIKGLNFELVQLPEWVLGLRWNLVKMFMYSSVAQLAGRRVFCFDLDVVITGNLDEILNYQGKFGVCEAAYSPGAYGGSLVSFVGGDRELRWRLWNPLLMMPRCVEQNTRGSERVWYRMALASMKNEVNFWQELFPGQVASYKGDCRNVGHPPPGARVVRFHGLPRPHQVGEDWVKRCWTDD